MAWGLFEALGSVVEKARGFLSGIFGEAARQEIEFPTISKALEAGGLEIEIPELHEDFLIQEQQTGIAEQIAAQRSDMLVPGSSHLETDRLLPNKYAYEVEITQYLEDGTTKTAPFYVGSDTRLTPDEILEAADENADESPDARAIGFMIGKITASWVCTEY